MVCGSLFAHLATVDLRKLAHKYWFLKETCPLLYPELEDTNDYHEDPGLARMSD